MPGLIDKFAKYNGTDFEDQGEVGWGYSGLVLKSLHRPTNHIVARKIIHESPRKRRELQVTHKEVEFYRKMAGVGTGNFVECFGVMPVGGKGHIHGGLVFEFMDAGSLSDFQISQNHRPVPEPIILRIAQNLLQACSALETLQIVHRDIKPSNILFNSAGEVKLCDFGEACFRWESEGREGCESGRMAGSTAYMSPERLAGLDHSHPADIWSVGLVLLELTSDNFPFAIVSASDASDASFDADCSIIELWEMVMETDPLPSVALDKYSQELKLLVDLCMKRDPKSRLSANQLLAKFAHLFDKNSASKEQFGNFITSHSRIIH